MMTVTSCKEDATTKIKSENVTEAADRDAVNVDFPVLAFAETEHDFGEIADGTPVETVFSYTNEGYTMFSMPVSIYFHKATGLTV